MKRVHEDDVKAVGSAFKVLCESLAVPIIKNDVFLLLDRLQKKQESSTQESSRSSLCTPLKCEDTIVKVAEKISCPSAPLLNSGTCVIYVIELEGGYYYVGRSDSDMAADARIAAHKSDTGGSKWTSKHRFVSVHSRTPGCSPFHEDSVTLELMSIFGIDKVRGGTFCNIALEQYQYRAATEQIVSATGCCFKCLKKSATSTATASSVSTSSTQPAAPPADQPAAPPADQPAAPPADQPATQPTATSTSDKLVGTEPVYNLGAFGIAPWGSASAFPDSTAQYIWNSADAATIATANTVDFAAILTIVGTGPSTITFNTIVDNAAEIHVNGAKLAVVEAGWSGPYNTTLINLQPGNNVIHVLATNTALGPAGLLMSITDAAGVVLLNTNSSSWVSYGAMPPPNLVGTEPVYELGSFGIQPWGASAAFPDSTAQYIWNSPAAAITAPANTVDFAAQIFIVGTVPSAFTVISIADNSFRIYLNGVQALGTTNYVPGQYQTNVLTFQPGRNMIHALAMNSAVGPAGLLLSISDASGKVVLNTNATSWVSYGVYTGVTALA